ncbi:MAG TPA: ribosome small subunit-dependent GTPase A [Microbacteriaceae bacterium]|nr:ribosome small subunit-dependent GTPase A [Microbacteriaceae bacterium]
MTDDEGWDDWSEDDVRIRPNPRGSRPRTKVRPTHEDAVPGFVIGVDRGRYRVVTGAGTEITATSARELGRGAVVVGDRVGLVGEVTGARGALARIVRVEPRTTLLRRSADDAPTGERDERIIVANADRMLIVVAAADPEPRPRLIDRYLVAAVDVGIEPILVMTKTDLADPTEFIRLFDGLGLQVVRSTRDDPPLERLKELIDGHIAVAVGHSGVGKSTLVNAIVPEAARATGDVNAVTGRGRHTSSSSVAYPVGSGWIVDTPGIRSFGLGHISPDHVLQAFPDLAAIADDPEAGCPRGCTHLADSPDCAIAEAIEEGRLGPGGAARLESLRRLLTQIAR